MRLLIITQKVDINDDVLGFFHDWIKEFSKHCEKITVICLQKGECDLPDNVKVLSLGKENNIHNSRHLHKIRKLALYSTNFYKYISKYKIDYDSVFVHMNIEYVILGGPFWRLWNKKIGLWYAHGSVSKKLKIAEKFTDIIFTSTKSGCRLNSGKIKVIGQGININKFQIFSEKEKSPFGGGLRGRFSTNLEYSGTPPPPPSRGDLRAFGKSRGVAKLFKIITVGRISPVKDYETLINATEILKDENVKFEIDIIGGAGLPEQEKYMQSLKETVKQKKLDKHINFIGPIANREIVKYLQRADLFVNMSHTGSLDKAIIEAMSCGVPILTCNEALLEVLSDYKNTLMFKKGDYKELAQKIKYFMTLKPQEREKIGLDLREIVKKEHSIDNLIKKIIADYN